MRLTSLITLLPLAIAAPAVPELSAKDWNAIQSGFTDRVWGKVSSWSWTKAEEIVEHIEGNGGGDEKASIWKQLKDDPNSFSKLVKAIEFAGEPAISVLDGAKDITFFAPNNDALKPPPHHHHHHDHEALYADLMANPSLTTVSTLLDNESFLSALEKGHDDDDHKKKKEFFRFIVRQVLKYHGLTHPYTAQELAENSTVATALKADDGSFAGLHRRIKVEKTLIPPGVVLNFYAKVLVSDRKASNGYFHTINHPLIPGPSIFDSAYNVPDFFSTLTSAVQGLHQREKLDWHYDPKESKPGKPHFTGTPLATLFTPTNTAFHALPAELKFYLFSPFGERALAKILAYHYIPKTLLLTELLVDQRKKHGHVDEVEYFAQGDDSYHKEFDIPTVLPNATLHIEIEKIKVLPVEGATKTILKVNGQTALANDVQARNGAFHVLGKVLVPPHHHHDHHGKDIAHEDSWENWQEWLPALSAEPLE